MTRPRSAAIAAAERGVRDACRRAALVQLAQACSDFQPASNADAVAVRDQVAALLDAESVRAADQGEDSVYAAFRALRQGVIDDLVERGASLSPFRAVTLSAPAPALSVAVKLYRDPLRADELVAQCDPVHPLFMPTAFTALAS